MRSKVNIRGCVHLELPASDHVVIAPQRHVEEADSTVRSAQRQVWLVIGAGARVEVHVAHFRCLL